MHRKANKYNAGAGACAGFSEKKKSRPCSICQPVIRACIHLDSVIFFYMHIMYIYIYMFIFYVFLRVCIEMEDDFVCTCYLANMNALFVNM